MALINCPECNKQVSDKANSCPNCGFPIKEYIETKSEEKKEYIEEVACDTVIIDEGELDKLYNFENGNRILIVQKFARSHNMDYSLAKKIVDDYFEKKFPENQSLNYSRQVQTSEKTKKKQKSFSSKKTNFGNSKKFRWKQVFLVLACIIFPFLGAVLLWIFKIPKKKIKRILLTLFLLFYSLIKTVSNTETEPNSENVVNNTEIIEEKSEEMPKKESLDAADEKTEISDEIKSKDEIFLEESEEYLESDKRNKLLSVLKDNIGFEDVSFGEKIGETLNYKIKADGYDLVATDVGDDFRVFIPDTSYVFYEDSNIVMTKKQFEDKIVSRDEASVYYIMAQDIIYSCLKDPSSADFPSLNFSPEDIGFKKNGDLVLVQSYVDANNSFGATMRSKWEVQFEVLDMDTYSYDLKYINFDGEKAGNYIDMD